MKKLIAVVAVAAGLMLGSVANAAQVDIFLSQSSASEWSLTVNNNGGSGVGAVNIVSTGLSAMVLNAANTGISPADSLLSIDPLGDGSGDWIVINNIAGQVIAAVGTANVLLATLSGPGPVSLQGSEGVFGSPTVFDSAGFEIADFSLTVVPTPPVPEPATTVLLGLGLAALALVRRSV